MTETEKRMTESQVSQVSRSGEDSFKHLARHAQQSLSRDLIHLAVLYLNYRPKPNTYLPCYPLAVAGTALNGSAVRGPK